MKRFFPLGVLVLVGLTASFLLAGSPAPDAHKLWDHITLESPYTSWQRLTQNPAVESFPMESPHGRRFRVFINNLGEKSDAPPYRLGTVIVRETLDSQEHVQTVTVKYKVDGFNPDGGNWYWAMYSPVGTVKKSGKVQGCIGCHSAAARKDYLLIEGGY